VFGEAGHWMGMSRYLNRHGGNQSDPGAEAVVMGTAEAGGVFSFCGNSEVACNPVGCTHSKGYLAQKQLQFSGVLA
jgi:hypothetical protein